MCILLKVVGEQIPVFFISHSVFCRHKIYKCRPMLTTHKSTGNDVNNYRYQTKRNSTFKQCTYDKFKCLISKNSTRVEKTNFDRE